ncbi:MAG: T9SS type A sorting domain-containing protein [Bacteroidales bacterium]
MKKFLTLIGVIACGFSVFSQSQRMVLLEQFTQASCGPCASANPTIKSLLASNPDKITSIFYHTSWPGYDPMYLHNTDDQNGRVSYYGVNAVPHSVLDGNYYSGSPGGWNINTVNNRYNVPSSLEMNIYSYLSPDQTKYHVFMLVEATQDLSSGLAAHMVVIEELIQFTSPPGSNGETQFVNVLKKMLPNKNGTLLPSMQTGEYVLLEGEWQHANVYSLPQLAVVGFVQNNSNKEVFQAGNSSATPFTPLYVNDVEVTDIKNIAQYNCMGSVLPVVKIRNNGSAGISTMDIVYSMNGGEPLTYQWTGNLAFLESVWVELPGSVFNILDVNTLEVIALNPNGTTDEYPQNNTRVHMIDQSLLVTSPVSLALKLDNNPQETTWELKNSQGTVLYSGGPYTQAGGFVIEQFQLGQTDCYRFFIYDSGGDGLVGSGVYKLAYQGSNIFAEGSSFGSKDEVQFSIAYTGIDEPIAHHGVTVSPNPSAGFTTVGFALTEPQTVSFMLLNIQGKKIIEKNVGVFNAGDSAFRIDLTGYEPGIYLLKVELGGKQSFHKLFLNK